MKGEGIVEIEKQRKQIILQKEVIINIERKIEEVTY